jgi:hypothetical protein
LTDILIDPTDLIQTALNLRSIAVELPELAADVGAACCCAMPGPVAGLIEAETAGVQASLSEATAGLSASADDLSSRATLISDDQSMVSSFDAVYATPEDTAVSTAAGSPLPDGADQSTSDWLSSMAASDGSLDQPGGPMPSDALQSWLEPMAGDGSADPATSELPAGWLTDMKDRNADSSPYAFGPSDLQGSAATVLPASIIPTLGSSTGSPSIVDTLWSLGGGQISSETFAPSNLTAVDGLGTLVDRSGNVGTIADAFDPGGLGFNTITLH